MAKRQAPVKDLRGMPEADLRAQLSQLQQDLWQRRMKARDGAAQQTHHMPEIRRQIARIHTLLNERRTAAPSAAAR